jgi:sugar lactone lactonase YvrE
MADEVRCIVDIRSGLGEGPVWSELEQALYWLDCVKPAVYRYDPATGENRQRRLYHGIGKRDQGCRG